MTVQTAREVDQEGNVINLADFLMLAVDRVTTPIEGMHRAIVDRSLRWIGPAGAPARHVTDTVIVNVYDALRATGWALGAAIGLGERIARAREGGETGALSRSHRGSRLQAAINAVWGDELEKRKSELRIEMTLRDPEGKPVDLTASGLAASFPSPSSRLVVLVHGLGQTESCWRRQGDGEPTGLLELLTERPSVTPVLVRFNSGRHVSENGRELARLLHDLWQTWPVPIEGIALVGHSMGGLVIRSASHVGRATRLDWVEAVDKVVTLSSPHLGAPLEKAVNVVAWGLRIAPESRPLADFLDSRSVGIKDLRFGALVEKDWNGAEPDVLLRNTVSDMPPLEGAEHHFVTGVITTDPSHPAGILLGDLMVRAASGTGRGRRRQIEATEVSVVGGRRHSGLLHDRRVLDQVLAWVAD